MGAGQSSGVYEGSYDSSDVAIASEAFEFTLPSVAGPYQLCSACERILSVPRGLDHRGRRRGKRATIEYPHHRNRQQLISAAEGHCPLCARAVFELETRDWQPFRQGKPICVCAIRKDDGLHPYSLSFDFREGAEPTEENEKGGMYVSFNFHAVDAAAKGEMVFHTNQPKPTDALCSTEDIDVRGWIDTCDAHHSCLEDREPSYIPPRLLDCGAPKLKLVDASSLAAKGHAVTYVALSHCWGRNPTQHVLRTDNIHQFHREIDTDSLPKSFTDAIKITRKLGVRFLWIDSLCIIQKGARQKEDWEHHVRAMADIYSNCYVNIAASHADNSHGGCFQSRPAALSGPCIVTIRGKTFAAELCDYSHVQNFQLNSRAWVFQERLLAPRALQYAHSDLFWECRAVLASGAYPKGVPGIVPEDVVYANTAPFEWRIPPDASRLLEDAGASPDWHWRTLVAAYAKSSITVDEDRLPAISGIARRFNEKYLDGERYLAGYFASQLPLALLWRTRRLGVLTDPVVIPSDYVAPSWSWASVVGDISTHEGADYRATARVESAAVELEDERNPYGKVGSASLTIKGLVLEMKAEPDRTDYSRAEFQYPWRWKGREESWLEFEFAWDNYAKGARVLVPGRPWRLLCVGELIDEDDDGAQRLKGLILKPVIDRGEPSGWAYERAGYWSGYAGGEREEGATIRTFKSVGYRRLKLV